MANNLFISYDLNAPGKDYSKVIEAIKGLGSWAKIQKSHWYVKSGLTAKQAADRVWPVMDQNDTLIVIDATNNDAHLCNIDPVAVKHVQEQWNR